MVMLHLSIWVKQSIIYLQEGSVKIEDLLQLEKDKCGLEIRITEVFQGYAEFITNYMLNDDNEIVEGFDRYCVGYGQEYKHHYLDEFDVFHVHY